MNLTKGLLIMKLSVILLSLSLQVSAAGYSQTVTLTERDVPVEKVFQDIRAQTGYDFFYNLKTLEGAGKVTLNVRNASIAEALDACFRGLPLTYTITDKIVVINQKPTPPRPVPTADANPSANNDIHGRVTDSLGNPLAGASVTVKGSKRGTQTNEKGEFNLKGIDDNATLVISFSGFESRTVKFGNQTGLDVVLMRSNSPLDQVQVIAYGTTNQRYSTGDVTTVSAKEIEQQPVINPLLALEGRVPGLLINQANGLPGAGVTVQIQGQNSIANGNDPFYVIDGVPYTSELLPNLGNMLGSSGSGNTFYAQSTGNPLSYINPADIESISVLKDADATSIYGSRAANGAILITTKKGKAGPARVDLNLQNGWGEVTRKLALLNRPQYLEMRHEALSNDGIGASLANGDYDLLQWDTTRYTNWEKALIGRTAQFSNLNAQVSGGNTYSQYLVGATFRRQTAVFPGDFADQGGSVHFNLTSTSVNRKFHLQLTGSYNIDDNRLPGTDLTSEIVLAPDAPPLYNKDGTLNWAPNAAGSSTWTNPLAGNLATYSNKANNLVVNAIIGYQLLPGLDIRTSFGYSNLQTNELEIIPLGVNPPEAQPYSYRIGEFGNNNINSWIIEPQADYKQVLGRHHLELLAGATVQQNNSNGQQLTGSGYTSDDLIGDINAASAIYGSQTNAVYKYNGLFGRLTYNWDERYLLTLTGRRDGSSRFGSANQFHDFAAAGAGWVFSRETFMKHWASWLSYGKLRASYGSTGNDQIGDYQYLSLYSSYGVNVPYQGIVALTPANLTNPYLQWELTKKLEFGGDLGFLKDRILIGAAYFRNHSSNQLLAYPLPILTGFASVTTNLAATVQNTGWELTLTATPIKLRHFSWSIHGNLTIPNNKLVSFPGLATSSYAGQLSGFVIGRPLNIIKLLKLIGVNDTTGEYEFASKSGPTYNPHLADNTEIVNLNPRFYGGLGSTVQYKGFSLDFLFQFEKRNGLNYFFGMFTEPGASGYNQPSSVWQRWQKPGDRAPIQKFDANYSIAQQYGDAGSSSAAYSDASYVRLKNIALSWEMPKAWLSKARMQSLRIYAQGQNLLTITHYAGLDPETLSNTSLPPLRVLTLGIAVGF